MGNPRIDVVGMGPGSREGLTLEAEQAIREADLIVGYTVYIKLLKSYFPEKAYLETPMRQEAERCRLAFAKAETGKRVAFVCSGDAGVYGLAGLILQMGQAHQQVEIRVFPGVTAALSGAALLGAPLIHDFCVISLSDLLTPWEKIEKRIRLASEADFVIVLYNPSSHSRRDYLRKACEVMLLYKSPETICGIARQIGRDGEESRILTLGELMDTDVDMFTTVFVGNQETRRIGDRMVTPRGYRNV